MGKRIRRVSEGVYKQYITERTRKSRAAQVLKRKLFRVVWLSDYAYTVDALAVRGDEGRVSLRKAVAS